MSSRPCTAICADGSPCKAWAVRGSDPARCAAHGGGLDAAWQAANGARSGDEASTQVKG